MDSQIAAQILLVFLAVVSLLCLYGILLPKQLIDWINNFWKVKPALLISVLLRLILGFLLIFAAPVSQYPGVFKIFGYLTLAAAILLLFIGRTKIGLLLVWVKTWPHLWVRAWLLLGLAFFVFLFLSLQ